MDDFLNDQRVQIFYSPQMREYYIPLKKSLAVQCIFYCPWCGKKLPESVRNEYYDIIENEYKIDITPDMEEEKNFPKDFLSDEWWKQRGL